MGPSGGTIAEEIRFVPTRRQCLYDLSNPIALDGLEIKDNIRFMNGDNPSVQFESGTQLGGNWGCSGCDGDVRRAGEYDYMVYREYKSIEENKNLVEGGVEGKKTKLNPFKNLKVNELRNELLSRGTNAHGLKPGLQETLNDLLGGTVRIPALLYGTKETIYDLNLQNYEVLFFEPMHCCMNHISNIFQELPHHLTDPEILAVFKETISISLKGDYYKKSSKFQTFSKTHEKATKIPFMP